MLHTINVIGCFKEIKASKFDKMGKFNGSPNLLRLSASLENKRWLRFWDCSGAFGISQTLFVSAKIS